MQESEPIFLDYSDAQDLVDRIAARALVFKREMSEPEKEAMASLLSNTGVKQADLINVNNLADNYAINAEIVGPDAAGDYERSYLEDALFSWEEDGQRHYCIQW